MPTKKKSANGRPFPARQGFFIALVLLGIGVIAFFSFAPDTDSPSTDEKMKPEAGSSSSQPLDFPSTEEGTFSAWVQERYFKDPVDPLIVFFSSEKIPGLSFVYYPEEQKLVAGMPPLVVEQVRFFDGQAHHLAYSFQKGGEQRLYYDGQLVGISSFVPKEKSFLTGMVVGTASNVVSEALYDVKIE